MVRRAIILCLVGTAHWALAVGTTAEPRKPAGRFDDQPVVEAKPTGTDNTPTTLPAAAVRSATPVTVQFDWPRVLLALTVVIGLIVALRLVGKRWLAPMGARGVGRVVRVLGRAPIGPRQQVVLLQVGRRVVVAADNGGQLSNLCQITDADEVATLLGQLDEPVEAQSGGFRRLFARANEDFEAEDDAPLATASPDDAGGVASGSLESASSEIAGLMDKVRGLANRFKK